MSGTHIDFGRTSDPGALDMGTAKDRSSMLVLASLVSFGMESWVLVRLIQRRGIVPMPSALGSLLKNAKFSLSDRSYLILKRQSSLLHPIHYSFVLETRIMPEKTMKSACRRNDRIPLDDSRLDITICNLLILIYLNYLIILHTITYERTERQNNNIMEFKDGNRNKSAAFSSFARFKSLNYF
jgi:hypothetical protein